MEPTESKFAHLLQPIRELTKNWEIDVASELNDYLEELDEMCITFDGGETRLNFAEAALLVQGSTCIYSKKVELLYSLVFQTLDYINDRNKKRSREAAVQEGDGGETRNTHEDDDMSEFAHVDLTSENSQKFASNTKACVVPLAPESLIPPDTQDKAKLPLTSVKGEMVFSQKDFRINLFIPGEEEEMLLRSAAATGLLSDPHPADTVVQHQSDDAGDPVEDFPPLDEHMELDQVAEQHVEQQQAAGAGPTVRERRQREPDDRKQQDEEDVWVLHDPYAVVGEERPVQPGKCYRVPDGLDDGGKRKRKRALVLQDFWSWLREIFDPMLQRLRNGPTFTDLNYIYLSTLKHKVRRQRRIFRRSGVVMSEEEVLRTFLQQEGAGSQQQEEEPLGGDDDGSDVEEDIPAEFGGGVDFISPEAQRDELTYEELVKLQLELLHVNSHGYTQDTALSRRVKDWEDKIRPELVLQEQRPPFDIHDYGEQIVGKLGGVGRCRTFASMVFGLDNFEACKYLLASLQLANDHMVRIDSVAGLVDSLDSMSLTLLSTQKATDRFKKLTVSSGVNG
uniref:Condensin-2 complex subunit H2 n=2 Tax=Nothobranchius TaxID=28779 RepID=A0A1A8SM08_9TELE